MSYNEFAFNGSSSLFLDPLDKIPTPRTSSVLSQRIYDTEKVIAYITITTNF